MIQSEAINTRQLILIQIMKPRPNSHKDRDWLYSNSALIISQRHERIIHLLDNLTLAEVRHVPLLALFLNLPLNPVVCHAKTINDLNRWLPFQLFKDEFAIGVASTNSHGPVDVLDGQVLLVIVRERHLCEFVHVHHFRGSQVDGDIAIRERQAEDALHAIVNEGEGARLLPVPPHLEFLLRREGLSAEGGGGLLTPSLPGSPGSVNVVETGDANVDGEVPSVRQRHLLGVELLEAVHVLGTGRPGVALDQSRVLGILLLRLVINAGR
mmetsp:Transcript_23093/g.55667  ORF Transcript_23093/g.55667 Transcript_23093/m.55667 type:complete len:268 (-) Transcript_23093:482-1285(-)